MKLKPQAYLDKKNTNSDYKQNNQIRESEQKQNKKVFYKIL